MIPQSSFTTTLTGISSSNPRIRPLLRNASINAGSCILARFLAAIMPQMKIPPVDMNVSAQSPVLAPYRLTKIEKVCSQIGAFFSWAICDISAGNAFLPEFMEQFNERFSVPAAKAENVHRSLNVQASRLADILCHREQRHVSQQLSLAYDRRQIILERSEMADKLAGQYVDVYDFSDRLLEVRWKGHSLPYRVFSKDQRVSHTAIIENKRLGHALALVKAQQEWSAACIAGRLP